MPSAPPKNVRDSEVQREHRRFRALVEHTSELVSIVDDRGQLLYCNPAHDRLLGYPAGTIREQGLFRLIHPDDRRHVLDSFHEVQRQEGHDLHVPNVRIRCANGDWLHVETIVIDLTQVEGVGGFVVSSRDITARVRAEKDVRNFKTISDRANYGALIIDLDGQILYANRAWASMHRMKLSEIIGRDLTLFHRGDQLKHVNELNQMLIRDRAYTAEEVWHTRSDGHAFPTLMNGTVVTDDDGEPMCISATAIDITGMKMQEAEVRHLNETLEERVEQRTVQVELMQSQLVEAEKMAALGGLVAGVAHEINTPVGVGVTAATHLREQTLRLRGLFAEGALKKSDLNAYLELCEEATGLLCVNLDRASGLIRSFKAVAVEPGRDDLQDIPVRQCLKGALESLQPSMRRSVGEVRLDCAADLTLRSAPEDVIQIISQLVKNSLDHGFVGRDDGLIEISAARYGDLVELVYRDDGAGMAQDVSEHIYDPFFTTRPSPGNTGLGLHIVYNLVTGRLGGQIACISAPGEGTEFHLTLPVDATADRAQ